MTDSYKPEGVLIDTPENRELTSSLASLEYAMNTGTILEGRAALCDSSHALVVELGAYRGIIPRTEAAYSIDGSEIRDIAIITRVGKPVCFKIVGTLPGSGKPTFLLSRRDAQMECYEKRVSQLRAGDVIDARITHIEPFGCFCDIGNGLVALLPVDCISVSRISHPKERFKVGDRIKCVVKSSDRQTGRITLTHKELLGTWEENAAHFCAGETAAGIIRSIEPYGIFVELAPNLAGLAEWCEGAVVGHCAAVYIKSILPEKMKIKLVIVDSSLPCPVSPPADSYYTDVQHMDVWRYSPANCEKEIVTVFE